MNVWTIIPLISFLTFAALVVLILQQARRRADKVFVLFLIASGVWSFTSFMLHFNVFPQQSLLWNELLVGALLWTVVSYYHFVRAYNNKPGGIGLYLGYTSVLAILGFSLSGMVVKDSRVIDGVLYHELGVSLYILGAIISIFLIAAMLMLINKYRSSYNPTDRNRTMYLIVGSGVVIAVSYLTNFTPTLAGLSVDHLGNLANALIIAYTIMKFQLLNIRFVARRVLVYFLIIISLGSIYAGSIFLGQKLFPTQPTYSIVLAATVLVLLLALLARPLGYRIEEWVDRFFYRKTYNYRQTLLDFSNRMNNIINLDELADEMLPAITKALHITEAKLLFKDFSSGDFTTQFTYPKVKGDLSNEIKFSVENPVAAWLDKESEPLNLELIDNTPEFKGLWKAEKEQITASNLRLLCPIKSRGRLIGILALGRKRANILYSHEDLELVVGTTNQAATMIENAQRYSQAIIRANTDGLTGLYNHRHFHERFDQEIARGSRFGTTFSLIMLDVDLFKAYNDIHGHLAGDEILREIAVCMRASIRNLDMAFRYGGEEFTIILPETRLDDAYKVAERIRKAIASKSSSKATPITASLGIASWPIDGVMREEIISCADAALYRAKQTGRNRTCLSSDVMKPETPLIGIELEARSRAISIIYALAATVDAKDHYTYGHSKKVSDYAVVLTETLGLPQDKIDTMRAAGLLHDIGKVGIPDSILKKKGPLTDEEWGPVREHPKLGVEILRHVIDLVNCLPAILHHHEHYDGSGYPSGLKGDNIPIEARILSIADAYDAITSPRPYHKETPLQEALIELKRCAGTQFDPELIDAFCKIIERKPSKRLEIK